jgi:hypothetical protein
MREQFNVSRERGAPLPTDDHDLLRFSAPPTHSPRHLIESQARRSFAEPAAAF